MPSSIQWDFLTNTFSTYFLNFLPLIGRVVKILIPFSAGVSEKMVWNGTKWNKSSVFILKCCVKADFQRRMRDDSQKQKLKKV